MDNKTLFDTSDLWLSSFLIVRGLKLINIKKEGKKAIFIFQDRPNKKELIEEFYDDGPVGIITIKNAITNLKSAIFNMP